MRCPCALSSEGVGGRSLKKSIVLVEVVKGL